MRDECRHFGVAPGSKVKIKKGMARGPGWYEAQRDSNELPGFAEQVAQIVGSVRMGRFTPVFNEACQMCPFKDPCVSEGFGASLNGPAKRKLDAVLAAMTPEEAEIGAIGEDDL